MNILQVIPRRMRFARDAASSVELCMSEWVSHSRHRSNIHVVAEQGDAPPLIDIDVVRLKPAPKLASWALALEIRNFVKRFRADLVIKQQHIPTAARLAWFNPGTPVMLQTHNYIDPPVKGALAPLKNALRRAELKSLAGITFISEATRRDFETRWPDVKVKSAVLSNGFDFSGWTPAAPDRREKTLLIVGRAVPAKGILECAQAMPALLSANPGWKALFILSGTTETPDYYRSVMDALKPLRDRAEIWSNVPYAKVRAASESAAIAIVASLWNEPFGRTALEAHAGGAALVSSGTGGLREISGDHAVFIDSVTPEAIATATQTLINDGALRERLTAAAYVRVRERFSLERQPGSDYPGLCETFDTFVDRVVNR